MFNDKYGLTQAVLEGRKTMTRRLVPDGTPLGNWEDTEKCSRYKVGEVVAVAQSYKDLGYPDFLMGDRAGWNNKMFVSALMCDHHIRITNVRIERLQDISDEDCIREGIEEDSPFYWVPINKSLPNWRKIAEGVSDMSPNDRDGKVYPHFWDSPTKAFAALIDKVSGEGTWDSNPLVFVYEFILED